MGEAESTWHELETVPAAALQHRGLKQALRLRPGWLLALGFVPE